MAETLASLPVPFWVVMALLAGGGVLASGGIRSGTGLPTIAVLGTVAAWYVGDVVYNDYQFFTTTFTSQILENAWWQVAWFLVLFLILVPVMHHLLNARCLRTSSSVYQMFRAGVNDPSLQHRLSIILRGVVLAWLALSVYAAFRIGSELPYYYFPFLDHRADPWGRGRLGSGSDALLSLASYLQIFVAATFGIVAALATDRRVRWVAALGCAFTWPYYIFDRTRNTMLTAMLPGILAWTFLRLRAGWARKAAVLAGFFLAVNVWFGFVIANRSNMSITDAFKSTGLDIKSDAEVHDKGLNMYEELCWINTLTANGRYEPNWGAAYFAELVNPIPRALWPEKPTIGLDYAVARGFFSHSAGDGGVLATISTGMIGQGVVNFGAFFGPAFAAVLMSLWVAILARVDLRGSDVTLYGLGLTLTFNLGRDITLITLYTFVFGALVVWALNRFHRRTADRRPLVRRTGLPHISRAN